MQLYCKKRSNRIYFKLKTMTLKQLIKFNDDRLKQYKDFVDTIDVLMKNKDDKKSIELLLEIQKLEFEGRIERGESEQVRLRKERVLEFERESMETNSKITEMIEKASKFIGKDPIGVTSKIGPLIDSYNVDNLTQEMRNDIYFELKGHYYFLTNSSKTK